MTRLMQHIMAGFCMALWATALSAQTHFTCDYRQYQYDMTLYYELLTAHATSVLASGNYELGAFIDDECRGVGEYVTAQAANGQTLSYGYLRIRSNTASGETITLRVYDREAAVENTLDDVALTFVSGSIVGMPSSPKGFVVFGQDQYIITFVLGNNQGNVVKSLTQGDVLNAPDDPTKMGFTFKGWLPALPDIVPSNDQTFTAQWERNSYQLTWLVDGKATTLQMPYEAAINPPANPSKEGHTFTGWDKEIAQTMPAEDLTYTALFTTNKYAVTYIVNGQEWARDSLFYGDSIATLDILADEGYNFSGWSSDNAYITMPDHDVVFQATLTNGIANPHATSRPAAHLCTLDGRMALSRPYPGSATNGKPHLRKGLYITTGGKKQLVR